MFPKLFSSLVLIDPVIVKPPSTEQEYAEGTQERTDNLILGALMRRDTWSSKYVLTPPLPLPYQLASLPSLPLSFYATEQKPYQHSKKTPSS